MKNILLITGLAFLALQCKKKEGNTTTAVSAQMEISVDSLKSYADETKKTLINTLTQKIEEGGAETAVTFCNTEAGPLVKSVAEKHGLEIKRVTDKPRNQNNLATEAELKIIEKYKQELLEGKALQATITDSHYYEPLVTNALCMQCHGEKGENIAHATARKIAELYPEDRAFGYREKEVRGLIRIEKSK
ncbi:MAG: DUF3365 domain-containing protein [Kaistella sp.]|nr:DUF3365 domain-containing protein [Kaistella sp.]